MPEGKKKKILYVAWYTPFDKVCHAGGQTLNYYIKGIAKDPDFEVTLVSLCREKDVQYTDTQKYGINTRLVVQKKDIIDSIKNIQSINSKLNPYHRFCNLFSLKTANRVLSELKKLKNEGYRPDVIILEWTESVLLVDDIKKIFPNAKTAASEHDVTFLRKQREADGGSRRKVIQAQNTYNRECAALQKCDKVITHNYKDKELLEKAGFTDDKLFVIVPFFHKSALPYHRRNSSILYFGDMTRPENREAADWFKKYVMPRLSDLECEFDVIGRGSRYVESIDDEFSGAMCFVCPLIHGAGIKIKVLEALYSGIPVLTNDIGIEGIPAKNSTDYIHCEADVEYEAAIREIHANSIAVNGQKIVEQNFNREESLIAYTEMLGRLINE